MAVGGLVAVAGATLTGLTLAPALVAVSHAGSPPPRRDGCWAAPPAPTRCCRDSRGLAQRRPWPVLLGCTALLLLLSTPLLALDLRNSDARTLPRDSEPRLAQAAIEDGYPDQVATPITVLVEAEFTSQETADAMAGLAGIPGVVDVLLFDPVPGDVSQLLVEPEPDAAGDYDGPEVQDLVRRLRAADLGTDVLVGGPTAELVDTRDALADRAPWAILVVALLTALLLGRLTRSVVVPLKAVALNLLSLGATLGVVVAVFQWGWGSSLLGFDSWGALDVTTPLLLFMFAFGLSMDYHVFLVARIREAWDEALARPTRKRDAARRPAGAQRRGRPHRHHRLGTGGDPRRRRDRDRVPRLRARRAHRGQGDRRRHDRGRAARRDGRARPAAAGVDDAAGRVELVAARAGSAARSVASIVPEVGRRPSSAVRSTGSSP